MGLSTDLRTLINRGRKAGLTTRELYSALGSRPLEGSDSGGQSDPNGFVPSIDQSGHRTFRPLGGKRPT
jgi:hypothetical protein